MTDKPLPTREVYIGDGVYARFDGYAIWLRTPRMGGDHEIALEPEVLRALDEYRAALSGPDEARQRAGDGGG